MPRNKREEWPEQWRGWTAVILSTGVSIALVAITITAALTFTNPDTEEGLTQAGAALLTTTLGAAIGALATYLGGAHQRPPRDQDETNRDEGR